MGNHYLQELVLNWHSGRKHGIMAACMASPLCIEAVMREAKARNAPVLIEATSNQVNQDGGYTGMKPADFVNFVKHIAEKNVFPQEKIILGGDHLGPQPFKTLPESEAMAKAEVMVSEYAAAGFSKMHLDTSMRLGDDSTSERLEDEIIAHRAVRLGKAAISGFSRYRSRMPEAELPGFIIGSEVPIPGGIQDLEETMSVTRVEDLKTTLAEFEKAFRKEDAEEVWDNVIGVVVQPGVEFGDSELYVYDREKTKLLTASLMEYPGLVFEGHSTDYQPPFSLRNMMEDGICILKVGPALTFYQREAFFALSMIEKELLGCRNTELSDFPAVLEQVMLENPKDWEQYYRGTEEKKRLKLKFSYSDRSRYYLSHPRVQKASKTLFSNLNSTGIPINLLSQFMPSQADKVRKGLVANDPHSLVISRIADVIADYTFAVSI